jgi:hypothetical protein
MWILFDPVSTFSHQQSLNQKSYYKGFFSAVLSSSFTSLLAAKIDAFLT